jgi:beta-phosphoglucomutase
MVLVQPLGGLQLFSYFPRMISLDTSIYKAFIFDMDGTMVDNMMVHHRAWQSKLEELGMPLPIEEVMHKVHGINEEILERLFGNQLTAEERTFHAYDKEARYRKLFKDSLSLVAGLDSLFEALHDHGVLLAVGSAAPPENVDFVLDNLNLRSLFSSVLHSGDVKKGKPDPEIYLKIADKLGVLPEECLVFEDSIVGAQAANNAGMPVVIIQTTHFEKEFIDLEVKAFIKDFTEVTIT